MSQIEDNGKLPKTFKQFVKRFPELGATHERIGKTVDDLGPLDAKTRFLIKIGICVGGGLESAMRSHVRRATQAGATSQEIEQTIMLGMNTVGFPRTVAAWSCALQQLDRDRIESNACDSAL